MKVIKVSDLQELLAKNGNMATAYDCNKLPVMELDVHGYEVELMYHAIIDAYSEDDAIEVLENMIKNGDVPYQYSSTTKLDD